MRYPYGYYTYSSNIDLLMGILCVLIILIIVMVPIYIIAKLSEKQKAAAEAEVSVPTPAAEKKPQARTYIIELDDDESWEVQATNVKVYVKED